MAYSNQPEERPWRHGAAGRFNGPTRYAEHPNGVTHMTDFDIRQIAACAVFGITPPAECMIDRQKEGYRRTTIPGSFELTLLQDWEKI